MRSLKSWHGYFQWWSMQIDIFGLLYSIQYASCESQGYMMSHHMVFKNFSLHGIPTKLLLQLHSHPTHLALLVELLTVSFIHEPNHTTVVLDTSSHPDTFMNPDWQQIFRTEAVPHRKEQVTRREGKLCVFFLEWKRTGSGTDSSATLSEIQERTRYEKRGRERAV